MDSLTEDLLVQLIRYDKIIRALVEEKPMLAARTIGITTVGNHLAEGRAFIEKGKEKYLEAKQ